MFVLHKLVTSFCFVNHCRLPDPSFPAPSAEYGSTSARRDAGPSTSLSPQRPHVIGPKTPKTSISKRQTTLSCTIVQTSNIRQIRASFWNVSTEVLKLKAFYTNSYQLETTTHTSGRLEEPQKQIAQIGLMGSDVHCIATALPRDKCCCLDGFVTNVESRIN